ncbi:MAG: aminotransferase class V-fold PLP-dependent enzyme, partial [Candidatus Omnitrophica bacterium]|nr:aminotransferase class V-fold PLP-dependent enzyme [Candidatus Omnitrophota bacterium]
MSIFREIPPTAGWPLQAKGLLAALENNKNSRSLNDDFKNYLGCSYAKTVYSGTAAFYIILESLKKISAKKTVIIPAFACPLIPLAIKRANLKIQVCDINPANFSFDLNQLKTICAENTDILAILSVHLAGLPIDLDPIMEIAKLNQAFVIEDCAQSLGAEYKNKKTGSIGDFAFFSLCRGKGLTIYEGGVITSKETNYSKYLDETAEEIV